VCAVASALLGLLAKDPSDAVGGPGSGQARLGAWALIALLLPLPFMGGCSETAVAQDIVNWTPALQSAVATVDSAAAVLAPADAPIFTAATAGFNAAANLLTTQAKAYLADPSEGTLAQLQNQIVTFEQQVNTALLQAGKIVNPASQQHALAAIEAVGTVVTSILALVQSVSTKAQVEQMAGGAKIKLAAVRPYLNEVESAGMVAEHYGEPIAIAHVQMEQAEAAAVQAGF
jgi:hypothetical protein